MIKQTDLHSSRLFILRKIFYNMFFSLMILIIASCVVTKSTTGKSSILGFKPIFVMTGSMEPVIHQKSFILGVPIDSEHIQVGDIVTYTKNVSSNNSTTTLLDKLLKGKNENIIIVHRVIKILDNGNLVFKGDANLEPDDPVSPGQIGYKIILY